MKQTVYLETTIISYLAARPSRDLVTAAHQHLTQEWWWKKSANYELYVSDLVVDEASAGDEEAASRRLDFLSGVTRLNETEEMLRLADELFRRLSLPPRAKADARHIAIAVVNGIDFLLTYNCTHIAAGPNRRVIEQICKEHGYEPPVICNPEEMLGESADLVRPDC